jgi:hypothetical protein
LLRVEFKEVFTHFPRVGFSIIANKTLFQLFAEERVILFEFIINNEVGGLLFGLRNLGRHNGFNKEFLNEDIVATQFRGQLERLNVH